LIESLALALGLEAAIVTLSEVMMLPRSYWFCVA
jgi:hypothetical protein